jgi:hypothetical protein
VRNGDSRKKRKLDKKRKPDVRNGVRLNSARSSNGGQPRRRRLSERNAAACVKRGSPMLSMPTQRSNEHLATTGAVPVPLSYRRTRRNAVADGRHGAPPDLPIRRVGVRRAVVDVEKRPRTSMCTRAVAN